MNKQQLSKNTMYKKMIQFFTKYDAVFILFTALHNLITSFSDYNDELDDFIDKQTPKSKGVTEAKNEAFGNMIKLAVRYGRKARVWAKTNGHTELAALLDIRRTELEQAPEEEALSKCRLIRNAVHDNISTLAAVNITAVNDAALDQAVKDAEKALGTPGSIIDVQEVGTEGIAGVMQTMDETLTDIDDLLIGEYEETDPEMVLEYENNRKIDNVGVRHNHIIIHTFDAEDNGNVAGSLIAVEGTGKSVITNSEGIGEIIKIKAGEYKVKVAAEGYITQEIILKVINGKTTSVEVKLKKK